MKQFFILLSVHLDKTTPISVWSELPSEIDIVRVVEEPMSLKQAGELLNNQNVFVPDTGIGYYLKSCKEGERI